MKKIVASAVLVALAAGADVMDPRVPALFEGRVMTNEAVLFLGTDDAAPLMYEADEILSVKSFDLTIEYQVVIA